MCYLSLSVPTLPFGISSKPLTLQWFANTFPMSKRWPYQCPFRDCVTWKIHEYTGISMWLLKGCEALQWLNRPPHGVKCFTDVYQVWGCVTLELLRPHADAAHKVMQMVNLSSLMVIGSARGCARFCTSQDFASLIFSIANGLHLSR